MTESNSHIWGPADLQVGQKYYWRGRRSCTLISATDVTAVVQYDDGARATVDRTDLRSLPQPVTVAAELETGPSPIRSRTLERPPEPKIAASIPSDDDSPVQDAPGPSAMPQGGFPCPECALWAREGVPRTFPNAHGLGVHRYWAHGVPGSHPSAAAKRESVKGRKAQREQQVEPPEPEDLETHQCGWRHRYEGAMAALRALQWKEQ